MEYFCVLIIGQNFEFGTHAKATFTPTSKLKFLYVTQSCPALCDPMNCSTPRLPVHHQLPEFTQTHVPRVGDAIQPSHPLSSPFPPAPDTSQHQSLFQGVNSSHEVAKVLETLRAPLNKTIFYSFLIQMWPNMRIVF